MSGNSEKPYIDVKTGYGNFRAYRQPCEKCGHFAETIMAKATSVGNGTAYASGPWLCNKCYKVVYE